jgi:hypothetical protein
MSSIIILDFFLFLFVVKLWFNLDRKWKTIYISQDPNVDYWNHIYISPDEDASKKIQLAVDNAPITRFADGIYTITSTINLNNNNSLNGSIKE